MELTQRATIVIGALLLALVLLLVLIIVFVRRERTEVVETTTPEYFDRELMIDEIDYEMPDPSARLLEPRVEYIVDPDEPFPEETARELEEDTLRSLHDSLEADLEAEIERLIREN